MYFNPRLVICKVKLPTLILEKQAIQLLFLLIHEKASFGIRRTNAVKLNDFTIMETINVKVTNVRVFISEDSANVTLELDKAIKGFALQDGKFVETEVRSISMPRSVLTAQLCACNDDIALFRATREHAFGQKEFGIILFGASLKLNRDLKAAGEIVNEKTLTRDCYLTTIADVTLSPRAAKALDAAIAL